MLKRPLSLLLTLVMVFGLVPISLAHAVQNNDVVCADESTSTSDLVDKGLVQMTQPVMAETPTSSGAVSVSDWSRKSPASVQALATAAGIYGCTAKQFFGVFFGV